MDVMATHAIRALEASDIPQMPHQGLGYMVCHAGEEANWLLTRVWMEGGIVAGLLGRAEHASYAPVTTPLIECVWEEIVAHHEREAWVRHMMRGEAQPQAYVQDQLPDGMY